MNSLSPINADFSGFLFLLELPLIRLFFLQICLFFTHMFMSSSSS